jgi:hypothetical protein
VVLAYAFFGFATLAKGLLGFALPGLILLVYILVTWDWKLLRRARLAYGLPSSWPSPPRGSPRCRCSASCRARRRAAWTTSRSCSPTASSSTTTSTA